jgi:simple sugar transport system permease protein
MTPLLLAALAGLISQRVNLLNIALEGLMLFGAFFAVIFGAHFENPWMGLLSSVLLNSAITLVFAFAVIELRANLIVAGLAINTLALGLTSFLLAALFDMRGAYSPSGLQSLPHITLPLVSAIPVIGPVFSGHGILVYLSWVLVVLTSILLYQTPFGIHLRAIGEKIEAAETAGIAIKRTQYIALLIGGILCALAGSQLAIGDLTLFNDSMINGRGFIALAAVFFGAGQPGLTTFGCFLFGLFEAIQYRLQMAASIPPQLPQMLPYLIVVISLTAISFQKYLKDRRTV